MNTVEGPAVTPDHPLASCDIAAVSSADIRRGQGGDGWCGSIVTGATVSQTENTPNHQCNINSSRFQNSFAVWGGITALSVPVCDGAGRCLVATSTPTVDPLESFGSNVYALAPSTFNNVTRSLRPRAIANTTAIICR